MRILIIEDDKSLSELLTYGLEMEGLTADICHDGLEGLKLAKQDIYDLILLDRMLPSMSGEKILTKIRHESIVTPIIFITAIGDPIERIKGLDLGADDYLVKPFDIGELSARIRSVIRRTNGIMKSEVIAFGDISFSEKESKLLHSNNSYILTKKEAELLSYFMHNPDKVLPRNQIIGNVWGPHTEIEDGNLDNYIYLLRKRFSSLETNVQIVTIHRQGYCLTKKES
jgi:DNA-binding response OmpR family regulator